MNLHKRGVLNVKANEGLVLNVSNFPRPNSIAIEYRVVNRGIKKYSQDRVFVSSVKRYPSGLEVNFIIWVRGVNGHKGGYVSNFRCHVGEELHHARDHVPSSRALYLPWMVFDARRISNDQEYLVRGLKEDKRRPWDFFCVNFSLDVCFENHHATKVRILLLF